MKKEDNAEGNFVQHEKIGNQETHSELLKDQLKNGILPWKSTEREMSSQTNEVGQLSLESSHESVSSRTFFVSHQELSRPLLLFFEDNAEDFDTELTPFNDLWDTSELVSCNEYLPYYRTYSSILETPENINAGVKQEDTETEGGNQSNDYVFKYEDKPLNDMGIATGYVPYWRSYEEYFGSPDLLSEVDRRAGNEVAEIDSTEEIESEIDYDAEEIFENEAVLEKHKTDKWDSQCREELIDARVLADCMINPCDSEISILDEIRSLNPPSSSGYVPYYRTYGHLLLSPEASSNTMFCSHEDALIGV